MLDDTRGRASSCFSTHSGQKPAHPIAAESSPPTFVLSGSLSDSPAANVTAGKIAEGVVGGALALALLAYPLYATYRARLRHSQKLPKMFTAGETEGSEELKNNVDRLRERRV